MMNYKLTVKDCLERIAATKPETILNAIEKGELRAVNIGNGLLRPTWRISEADFAAWIEKRTARPMLAPQKRTRRRQEADVIKFF